ncbi:MAG: ANTAR domain-containing response regulator [Deltaproteobacteria bacterium]
MGKGVTPRINHVVRRFLFYGGDQSLKVLIAIVNPALKKSVKDILTQRGFQVVAEARNAADVLRKARSMTVDLIILDAALEGGRVGQAAMILEEDWLAPVLILAGETDPNIGEFTYVLKPVVTYSLIPAIESILMNYKKRASLQKEVEKLKQQLATRKLLDVAKGLLIKEQGINEEEAHRLIQKMSMDTGIPLKAVAEAIIAARNN